MAPSDDLAARHMTGQVVAVTEEVLHVGKRTVETGRVPAAGTTPRPLE